MKKPLSLLIFLILIFPIISAVEFEIKSNYSQGETLIAKFSANFVDAVTVNNVIFYRGHTRTSIEPHLTKIGEEYYLYAQLSERIDNYSLRLENVKYLQGSSVIDEDVIQNFTITNETADFWVEPGVIVTADNFELQMQNLNEKKITINLKIETETGDAGNYISSTLGEFEEGDEKNFSLITGAIRKIQLKTIGVEEDSLKKIILSTNNTIYEVPLYVIATPVSNKKEKDMRFNFEKFQIKIPTGETFVKILKLQNIGQETLEDITISFSDELIPYLELPVTEIEKLEPDEEIEIGLYFTKSVDEKVIEGQLKAQTESGINAYTGIMIIYLQNYEMSEAEEKESVIKTCSEMGGKICETDEKCSIDLTYAKDGICCEGNCVKQETTSYGWLGWSILIIIVLGIGWFFFKKYRGVKSEAKLPFKSNKSFSNLPEQFPPLPKQIFKKPSPEKIQKDKNLEDDALKKLQEFKRKYGKR